MALDDQKEATERSEQQAANEILDSMENLDERVISTDARKRPIPPPFLRKANPVLDSSKISISGDGMR
jgi:hypothetical protein